MAGVKLDVELTDQEWDDLATALLHGRRGEARAARYAPNPREEDAHLIRAHRINRLAVRLDREKKLNP